MSLDTVYSCDNMHGEGATGTVEKNRYPQIPSTVWWGVRAILQRTPSATVDERLLGIQLDVQEAAARAYIGELRSVGILSEENKATKLAQKWRLDESYAEAVQDIVSSAYPQGLIDVAPPGAADRQKVVSWFLREGFGQGAAGNKAATYLLLSSPEPNDAPSRPGARPGKENIGGKSRHSGKRANAAVSSGSDTEEGAEAQLANQSKDVEGTGPQRRMLGVESFPLNINVQVHISADAGTEQIESIFQAMRRYLYDAPNT